MFIGTSSPDNFEDERQLVKLYWDDLSGKERDTDLVKKTREEEMKEFKKHGVYEKVKIEECWRNTGKDPIGTLWVDDDMNPEYRSRLVAQEINIYKREYLCAATRLLEAKQM